MDKDYLIEKWLNGELSEEERAIFMADSDFKLNEKILKSAKQFRAAEFSNPDDFKSFKDFYDRKRDSKKSSFFSQPLLRIAALLVIALGLYFTFMYDPISQYNSLAGEQNTFELPDQSIVNLNAVSELSFFASNWKDNRRVSLKGEAFFKVSKGNTFDVVTPRGTITVVGTEFNVKSRHNYFEVKCYEGIVKVVSDTLVRTLNAGQTFQLINDDFKEGLTTSNNPNWIQNTSQFNAIPYYEIINELERQFNIDVRYNSPDSTRLFTGGFEHKNLKTALISITKPMNLTFEMASPNEVVILGNEQ